MASNDKLSRFSGSFNAVPDPAIIVDEKAGVVAANAAADRLLGLPRGGLTGKPLDPALFIAKFGGEMERLSAAVASTLSGRREESFEVNASLERPGPALRVLVRPAGDGDASGAVIFIADISQRMRVRRELILRNEGLVEMARANRTIMEISSAIHSGSTLDEIFGIIFDQMRKIIPYDRIGLSLLDEKGEMLTATKVKSDGQVIKIGNGYRIKLNYSKSLPRLLQHGVSEHDEYSVLEGGRMRIINDLEKYVASRGHKTPYNELLLEEGIRSSLTVPLYVEDRPTGFIFFSSRKPGVYTREHLGVRYDTFMKSLPGIQDNMAVALEKAIAAQRLSEANARLKDLLEMKDNFLSIASHDLRSPLTAIIGFGRMMAEKTPVTEVQRRGLDIMVSSAGHLLMLVDDILSLAKRNAGKMELNLQPFTVGEVVRDSLQAMAFNAHNKEVTIEHSPLSPSPQLSIDRLKMFQVFNNLIGNAIKFSPVGSVVTVRESFDGGMYRCEVKDEGPGIDAEDQKRLFNRYVQVGDDAEMKSKGTGLGLAICKMIVEMHGGAVGVESEPGKGALFHFTIPVKQNAGGA